MSSSITNSDDNPFLIVKVFEHDRLNATRSITTSSTSASNPKPRPSQNYSSSTYRNHSTSSLMSQPAPFIYEPKTLRSPSAIVHLEYDLETLEPKPSGSEAGEWTRFVCISDTHGHTFDVPEGDVLLHSGDLTNTGTVEEFRVTMEWLCGLPHKVKIVIAGNHDLTLHQRWYEEEWDRWHKRAGKQSITAIRELLKGERARAAGIVYLQDEQHTFQVKEGGRRWSVFGSPWSPFFFNWAFNYEREDGAALVSKFPKTDILLTHGPAYGIYDRTNTREFVGCEDLLARLPSLRPLIHVSGHIHEARGALIHEWKHDAASGKLPIPTAQNDNIKRRPGTQEKTAGQSKVVEQAFAKAKLDPGKVERSVLVNAANAPSGPDAWRETMMLGGIERRVGFGGVGFQPVVVDLKDEVGEGEGVDSSL